MRAGAIDQPLPYVNSSAPSSTHGYRTPIDERNQETLTIASYRTGAPAANAQVIAGPNLYTCATGSEVESGRQHKRHRNVACRSASNQADQNLSKRSQRRRTTANAGHHHRKPAPHTVKADITIRDISRSAWSSTTSVTPIRENPQYVRQTFTARRTNPASHRNHSLR